MSDEVVEQTIQTAGNVGQTQSYLNEQADPGPAGAVLNNSLVHLDLDMK